jgi:excisionase family DNA binding protein
MTEPHVGVDRGASRRCLCRGELQPCPCAVSQVAPGGGSPDTTRSADPRLWPSPLLTVDEVAAWIRTTRSTLYAWRRRAQGPRAIMVGKVLRYRRGDVERWLEDHTDRRP